MGPFPQLNHLTESGLFTSLPVLFTNLTGSASDFWSIFYSCRRSFHKWFREAHLSLSMYMPWSSRKPRQLGRLSHFVKCFRCQNPPGPLKSLTLRKSHFAYGGCMGLFLFILVHRKLSFSYTKLQFLLFLLHPAVTPLLLSVLSGFVCVSFQAISHAFYLQVCSSWKCIINFRGNYLIFHE